MVSHRNLHADGHQGRQFGLQASLFVDGFGHLSQLQPEMGVADLEWHRQELRSKFSQLAQFFRQLSLFSRQHTNWPRRLLTSCLCLLASSADRLAGVCLAGSVWRSGHPGPSRTELGAEPGRPGRPPSSQTGSAEPRPWTPAQNPSKTHSRSPRNCSVGGTF